MKQMSLIEMDGFLKGKCIPRDLGNGANLLI